MPNCLLFEINYNYYYLKLNTNNIPRIKKKIYETNEIISTLKIEIISSFFCMLTKIELNYPNFRSRPISHTISASLNPNL